MGKVRARSGPTDPQVIQERRALERAQERLAQRQPGNWGVSADILHLPTAANVDLVFDQRGKVLHANRSDPFDLLYANVVTLPGGGERRGLSEGQHRAARRLFRLWCLRAGVQDSERPSLPEKIDGGRSDPSGRINQVMIDAGGTIAAALRFVGPVNARILGGLISPIVDQGVVLVWRAVLERVTGEKDRNAQGALVRQACEALRLFFKALGFDGAAGADGPGGDEQAGDDRFLRPFTSFGDGPG
jgi:hypothetical protein